MLRIEWGLDLAASPVDGGSYLRVGDELTEGLTDVEAASETLVARIHRVVKLINSSRWSQEHLVAIKRAASLAENRIIAAADGFSSDTHAGVAARRAVRVAFSDYLTTLETLVGSS